MSTKRNTPIIALGFVIIEVQGGTQLFLKSTYIPKSLTSTITIVASNYQSIEDKR